MDRLLWRHLLAKPLATVHNGTCLDHLGRCDTDRIISFYVAPHKVAKESKEGRFVIVLNFANVNTA